MIGSRLLFIAAAIVRLVHSEFQEINIDVGMGGLYIVHPSLPASIGDVLLFRFSGGDGGTNYSVVQGTYDKPCWPLEGGFFSGFMPVPPGESSSEYAFLVTVNTTDPLYYYCGAPGDCQAGMVATVNAPYDVPGSFLDYQSLARKVTSVGPLPTAVTGGQISQIYTYSTTPTSSSTSSSSSTLSQTSSTSPTGLSSSFTTGSGQATSTTGSSPSTSTSGSSQVASTGEPGSSISTTVSIQATSTAGSGSSALVTTTSLIFASSGFPSTGSAVPPGTGLPPSVPPSSSSTSTPVSPPPFLGEAADVPIWNTGLLLIVGAALGVFVL